MNYYLRAAVAIAGCGFTAIVSAQIRYDVGGAVKSVAVQGTDVVVEIDLVILDGNGNKVPGFRSAPGAVNQKTVEVRAYLCMSDGRCRFERMMSRVGEIGGINAYAVRASTPFNSAPYPGGYLMGKERRLFWIGVREVQRDLSRRGSAGVNVVGQGSTIISASGDSCALCSSR